MSAKLSFDGQHCLMMGASPANRQLLAQFKPDDSEALEEIVERWNVYPRLVEALDSAIHLAARNRTWAGVDALRFERANAVLLAEKRRLA